MRQRIKEIATELLIRLGYRGFLFKDVAAALDITRANIHYHFGSKTRLVEEVIDDYMKETVTAHEQLWTAKGRSLASKLFRDHGENARFLLLPTVDTPHPLRRHGEILEQLGGHQSVLRSQSVITEASRLYADPETGKPRKGVAGNGRGSIRRLALVLRQLDLTFDVEAMNDGHLLSILPGEFDRWKSAQGATGAI